LDGPGRRIEGAFGFPGGQAGAREAGVSDEAIVAKLAEVIEALKVGLP
jgi:hypothetical protein